MKTLLLIFTLALTFNGYSYASTNKVNPPIDTIKLRVDSNNNTYYQKSVKVAGNIMASQIYERTLQFMAAKNFVQTYGDDQQWKLIFTTSQDLNINTVYVGDDNDEVDQYAVQFAITVDMRNGRYRYTINNVLFFLPAGSYNKRETLFDVYVKATNTESKRVAKNNKLLLASFERYLATLTDELHQGIEQKAVMYNPKF
jgi:hypothetical protein